LVSVRLENVTKRFGSVVAVRSINMYVGEGEFTVILGPSGCGKTTTLRIIAGLEYPDEGRVYFDDVDVTWVPANKRGVGMVFQSYAVWPHMTVYDNIALPLKLKKLPKDEIDRRVKEAAELLRISHLLNRYPSQLSGGERQRVAVARAIAFKPKLLLMDEPLSNLDALLRVHARAELKKLQKSLKITTIYVTHDQVEAMVLADKVIVMNEGEIQQVGTPEEVYTKPSNTFVASFIGTPPMNLVEAATEGESIVVGGYRVEMPGVREMNVDRVIIGVRPEDVKLNPQNTPPNGLILDGIVELVEDLGSEYIAHVKVGSITLKVKRAREERVEEGSRVKVFIEWSKLHFFDIETGKRIARQFKL